MLFVDLFNLAKYFRHLVLIWIDLLDLHEVRILLEFFGEFLLPLLVLIGCERLSFASAIVFWFLFLLTILYAGKVEIGRAHV